MFAAACGLTAGVLAYAHAPSPLMTTWGEKITPENAWREYPRPQMVRANWTNLNGEWDYAVTCVTNTPGRPTKWDGKILVPFCLESALSGVGRLLEPDQLTSSSGTRARSRATRSRASASSSTSAAWTSARWCSSATTR